MDGKTHKDKWEVGFIKDYLQGPSPENIERFIRAMQSWPQAWTEVNGKRLKILKAHLEEGKLVVDEVQLEGKNPVTWKQFKEAYPGLSL
jgi:methionyl-tRNA formyltransferase